MSTVVILPPTRNLTSSCYWNSTRNYWGSELFPLRALLNQPTSSPCGYSLRMATASCPQLADSFWSVEIPRHDSPKHGFSVVVSVVKIKPTLMMPNSAATARAGIRLESPELEAFWPGPARR